jgi:gas vesicle protein
MGNRDGFGSGFFLGATLGGLVGGVLGVVLANRISNQDRVDSLLEVQGKPGKATKFTGDNMETARLSLEDKISQLNQAIDDVRQQLGSVNGNNSSETYD